MWFDYAIGKKQIDYMFQGQLSVRDAEFYAFKFDSYDSLNLEFAIKGLPEVYPSKWEGHEYNALMLTLTCLEINQFHASGTRVHFTCTPEITTSPKEAHVEIVGKDMNLFCRSKFLVIDKIAAYSDERWD